jgi:hypothetical protein
VAANITPPKRREVVILSSGYASLRLSSFMEEVSRYLATLPEPMANIATISTSDAVDLPTAIAMANECKAKINEILAELQTSGVML